MVPLFIFLPEASVFMNLHFSNLVFAVTEAKKHFLSLCYLSIKHFFFPQFGAHCDVHYSILFCT